MNPSPQLIHRTVMWAVPLALFIFLVATPVRAVLFMLAALLLGVNPLIAATMLLLLLYAAWGGFLRYYRRKHPQYLPS
jgi:hypothetical protein